MLGGILVSAFLYSKASALLLRLINPGDQHYIEFLSGSLEVRTAAALLMMILFLIAGSLIYYLQEQAAEESRLHEIKRIAREAELITLRDQLQPHFLFNTLNSVSALAGSNPEKAREMIQQLSEFLRGTLTREKQAMQTLKDELHHLELYLSIEKIRFGHRLETIIEAEPGTLQMQLPSLVLQPLMENAIKFGLYDISGPVTISIRASVKNKMLKIVLVNPYDSQTSSSLPGTGFGLESVKRKLYLLYGRNDLLLTNALKGLYEVVLLIPPKHE